MNSLQRSSSQQSYSGALEMAVDGHELWDDVGLLETL